MTILPLSLAVMRTLVPAAARKATTAAEYLRKEMLRLMARVGELGDGGELGEGTEEEESAATMAWSTMAQAQAQATFDAIRAKRWMTRHFA